MALEFYVIEIRNCTQYIFVLPFEDHGIDSKRSEGITFVIGILLFWFFMHTLSYAPASENLRGSFKHTVLH